jgi:membrane-bound lytic murein transglycosylase B
VAEFRRNGVVPRARIGDSYKAALFRLEERRGESYRLGFNNFYVITRYNNSVHYGMAVLELSNEIRARYRGKF